MGIINSVKNFVFQKSYDDDEYVYEYDAEYDGEYDNRFKQRNENRDENVTHIERHRNLKKEAPSGSSSKVAVAKLNEKDKVYTISSDNMQIVISEPADIDDASSICDFLKQHKPVIVNMEAVDMKDAQRIMDFLSGVVYSIQGDIQTVTSRIFIVAPENVDVSDHTKEHLRASGIFSSFKTAFGGR